MDKRRERQAIEDLQRLHADFPLGTIEDGEVPDFIVRTDGSCVGVEVTEYFRPERPMGRHPKEQESLKEHICTRATEICVAQGAPPLWGVLSFAHGVRISKRDLEPVATAVAAVCRQTGAGFVQNDGQLPPCIDDIRIHPLGPNHSPTITCVGTTWVPPTDETELARIISGKEWKLEAHRTDPNV